MSPVRRSLGGVALILALIGCACTSGEPELRVSSASTCSELVTAASPVMEGVIEALLAEVVGMDFEDFATIADDEVPGFEDYAAASDEVDVKATELGCDPNLGPALVCDVLDEVDRPDEDVSVAILDGLVAQCEAEAQAAERARNPLGDADVSETDAGSEAGGTDASSGGVDDRDDEVEPETTEAG